MNNLHTPGPWRWEFNEKHKSLTLVGGRPRYDLTIMEFCRWGMWGAGVSMRDIVPEADGVQLMHKVHERPDWITPFKGREHHRDWCAAVSHPDMVLMQAAPELLEALEKIKVRLEVYLDDERDMAESSMQLCLDYAQQAIAKARGEKC